MIGYTSDGTHELIRDIEADGRVFHLTAAQYRELEEAEWDSFDEFFIVPPYPKFILHVDGVDMEPVIDNPAVEIRTDRLYVDASASAVGAGPRLNRFWFIAERCSHRSLTKSGYDGTTVNETMCDLETGEILPVYDAYWEGKVSGREFIRMARVALSFVMMLQHRGVSVEKSQDVEMPVNRQQRRQWEREGRAIVEHYVVHLRPNTSYRAAAGDIARGENSRHPRPTEVRAHIRRLKSGAVTRVRNYSRGRGPAAKKNEYDVQRLPVDPSGRS